jgi:hypothetical protein
METKMTTPTTPSYWVLYSGSGNLTAAVRADGLALVLQVYLNGDVCWVLRAEGHPCINVMPVARVPNVQQMIAVTDLAYPMPRWHAKWKEGMTQETDLKKLALADVLRHFENPVPEM